MNEEYYAQLYAKYHGANAYETAENKTYVKIPLYGISNSKLAYLKMKSLRKNVWRDCDRPLAKALVVFFDVKTPVTVCHNKETTWCALLGNGRLVYPQENGDVTLTATPHFVQRENLDGFHSFVVSVLGAASHGDGVYKYNGAAIYLDPFDVFYPGGTYFAPSRREKDDWYRLCMVTKKGDPFPDVLHNLVREKYLLVTNRLKTKHVETKPSPFLDSGSPQRVAYDTTEWLSTNLVNLAKCYVRPSFVLQDVLDSYGVGAEGKPVGLLIEAPIRISYVLETLGGGGGGGEEGGDEKRFLALAVNCTTPERILYVPRPYDRYNEIRNDFRVNVRWTKVLYDEKQHPGMTPVVWDGHVVGYSYKNTFFCFSHVKLESNLIVRFRNAHRLFETLSFDVIDDPEFFVMHVQNVEGFVVYSVKHRFFKYELHCARKQDDRNKKEEDEAISRYQKRVELTPLVRNWLNLIANVSLSEKGYPDLESLKLVNTFVRHRVCFELRETPEEEGDEMSESFEGDSIVFRVNETIKKFVNGLRFDAEDDNGSSNNNNKAESDICVVS